MCCPIFSPNWLSSSDRRKLPKSAPIRRWPKLRHGHRHELFAAVAIARDGGVIDCQKAQAVTIADPHWNGTAFEEQPERFLAAGLLGHVLVGCNPSPIIHRPTRDQNQAAIAQPIYMLVCLSRGNRVQSPRDERIGVFQYIADGVLMFENRFQESTRACLSFAQVVQVGILLVANDEPLIAVKHA